jgi:hypothetical protein
MTPSHYRSASFLPDFSGANISSFDLADGQVTEDLAHSVTLNCHKAGHVKDINFSNLGTGQAGISSQRAQQITRAHFVLSASIKLDGDHWGYQRKTGITIKRGVNIKDTGFLEILLNRPYAV